MESGISPNGHVRATEIIVNRANLYESILKKKIIITILNINYLHFDIHKIDTLKLQSSLVNMRIEWTIESIQCI